MGNPWGSNFKLAVPQAALVTTNRLFFFSIGSLGPVLLHLKLTTHSKSN
jgi:hypothetical protein